MAAVPDQGCAEGPLGRQRQGSGYDQARQRNASGHLREASALLLQGRHEGWPDQVPERLELRRPLARRRTQRQTSPLSRATTIIKLPTTRSWVSSDPRASAFRQRETPSRPSAGQPSATKARTAVRIVRIAT